MKRHHLLVILAAAVLLVGMAVARDYQKTVVTDYPNPYASPEQVMEGIYAARDVPPSTLKIGGVIVPHHQVATETIARGIAALKGQTFSKVLLVSPDHFFACPTLLCTTHSRYQTLFSSVESDPSLVDGLLASPLVSDDAELFKQEHGIYAVLPYLSYYFPDVSVTPLVIAQEPWRERREELINLFDHLVDDQTMLIVSSDFSHYLTYPEAESKDAQTIDVLLDGDLEGIASLDNPSQSDCPNCLWVLSALMQKRGFSQPYVLLHTNAAAILKDLSAASTTSHYAIVYLEPGS